MKQKRVAILTVLFSIFVCPLLTAKDSSHFEFCSSALQVLGITSEQVLHLTEDEAERLYTEKWNSIEARYRMAQAFIGLGLQKLGKHGIDSSHPQYTATVESLFYNVILPAVGRFDQAKRGELTRHRSVKNNLASYMIGIFRWEIGHLVEAVRKKQQQEISLSDLRKELEDDESDDESLSKASRIWIEPDQDDVLDSIDNRARSNAIHSILEEYFKKQLKRGKQYEGRVRIQRLILEEVWKKGRPMIDVVREDKGVRPNFEDAQNDMRAAIRRGIKNNPVFEDFK